MRLVVTVVLAVLLASPLAAAPARSAFDTGALRTVLHEASVVVGNGCAGVLTELPDLVFTALHCVDTRETHRVRFTTGATRTASVIAVDRAADQALLLLDEAVPIAPLSLARRPQIRGSILYFEGNPSRPRFQQVRLERSGTCPSLPHLPNALFTTIDGTPGDSGAPVVDAAGRVVGLVHGGARCHIVTPANTLRRLIERVFEVDGPLLTDARLRPGRFAVATLNAAA